MKVDIQGKEYQFRILDEEDRAAKESFNRLARETFGISFDHIGGQYLPYVLMDGNRVAANVSVNHIHLNYQGESRFYIQLGTVMTDAAYRKKGLSRWLMEQVLSEWEERCDGLYLFANDSVLDFYPKFGFVKREEYHWETTVEGEPVDEEADKEINAAVRRLNMESETDREILLRCYQHGNPYSRLAAVENTGVLMFYCAGFMNEHVYYLEKLDLAVVAEYDAEYMECCDIYGKSEAPLCEVLEILAQEENQKVVLGFTPLDTSGFQMRPHKEEDTTLFVLSGKEDLFENYPLMFPVLSHT